MHGNMLGRENLKRRRTLASAPKQHEEHTLQDKDSPSVAHTNSTTGTISDVSKDPSERTETEVELDLIKSFESRLAIQVQGYKHLESELTISKELRAAQDQKLNTMAQQLDIKMRQLASSIAYNRN